jgi:hypothetical protein
MRGAAKPLRRRARSMVRPAGQWKDIQGLQLGTDGRGTEQSRIYPRRPLATRPSGPACAPAAKLGIPRAYPMGIKGNAEES